MKKRNMKKRIRKLELALAEAEQVGRNYYFISQRLRAQISKLRRNPAEDTSNPDAPQFTNPL